MTISSEKSLIYIIAEKCSNVKIFEKIFVLRSKIYRNRSDKKADANRKRKSCLRLPRLCKARAKVTKRMATYRVDL